MKSLSSLSSIVLFIFVLLFLTSNLAAASFAQEAFEIPYQINNSDRIIIGTVNDIDMSSDHTIITIKVSEWLYNSLPIETIKVRTERGVNLMTEVEPVFNQNESVLLMLNDMNLDQQLFRVGIGVPGKHPASDRDAVIEELKVQGKWKIVDQIGNKTNEAETIINTGTVGNQNENITENKTDDSKKEENTRTIDKQEKKSDTTHKSSRIPFISSTCAIAIVLGTVAYVKNRK
jgi:hypothetical protein